MDAENKRRIVSRRCSILLAGGLFCILIPGFFSSAQAQQGHSIIYYYPDHRGTQLPNKLRLVFNDSLSYWYMLIGSKDPFGKSASTFGEKMQPHGTFYKKSTGETISSIYYSKRNCFLYKVDNTKRIWQKHSAAKNILGYHCMSMLSVSAKNDSILVYFTDEILGRAAPMYVYNDVPGVVLEIFDGERDLHLLAEKITPGDYGIVIPSNVDLVNEGEKHRRIKRYLAGRNVIRY